MANDQPASISKQARFIITIAVSLATLMQTLDSTIANVALPHIQGALSSTQEQIAWVLTSYIIATAITTPFTGWISGYIGRKKILLISVSGFIVTSILCGLSNNLIEMILFRFLQGMCGASLIPLSQSVLMSINTKENFGKAISLWAFGATIGVVLGPLVGGYLTENYNWRWIFFINIPIGALALIGISAFLKESETHHKIFDFFGFVLLSVCLAAFQLLLDRGSIKGWFSSNEIIIETLIAGLFFYLFIIHTLTKKETFLNLKLFKDKNFTYGVIIVFMMYAALFSTLALIPSMLQLEMNYPVITTGRISAMQGFGIASSMLVMGYIIKHIDTRYMIVFGLGCVAFSLWQMSHYSLYMTDWSLITPGIIQGIGIGCAYVSLSTIAFAKLSEDLHDEGAAFFNLMRNLGCCLGISIAEACLVHNQQVVHSSLVSHITPYHFSYQWAPAVSHIDIHSQYGLTILNAAATHQAIMLSYIDDFHLLMMMTLCVMPLVLLLKKVKSAQSRRILQE